MLHPGKRSRGGCCTWSKAILDAKYDKADIDEICKEQAELDKAQRDKLGELLRKYEALFDGQLGHWHGQDVKLELKEGVKPYHARACNIVKLIESKLIM